MKKLELLKKKELNSTGLKKTIGGSVAPDYTVHNTQCTDSVGNSSDCDDTSRDKDK